MEPRLRGSLDSTSSPRGCPLRRGMIAAAGLCQYWIPVSGAIVIRQFRILYSYLCSGWNRSRFSRVAQLVSFVFHYWGEGRLFLRLRIVLLLAFIGFALTASRSFIFADTGVGMYIVIGLDWMGYPFSCSFSRTSAFYDTFAPGIIGAMGLHYTKLLKWRGQR